MPLKRDVQSADSSDCCGISRLLQFSFDSTLCSPISENTSNIANFQHHVKGIGAPKFYCADWVYNEENPIPLLDCVCKAEFWTSGKWANFRSHLARRHNPFDVARFDENVVHLRTFGGIGANAGGSDSSLEICVLNPTTMQNDTTVGLLLILTITELPKGRSLGLPPLAVSHLALGKPLLIAGNLAEVWIINSQL